MSWEKKKHALGADDWSDGSGLSDILDEVSSNEPELSVRKKVRPYLDYDERELLAKVLSHMKVDGIIETPGKVLRLHINALWEGEGFDFRKLYGNFLGRLGSTLHVLNLENKVQQENMEGLERVYLNSLKELEILNIRLEDLKATQIDDLRLEVARLKQELSLKAQEEASYEDFSKEFLSFSEEDSKITEIQIKALKEAADAARKDGYLGFAILCMERVSALYTNLEVRKERLGRKGKSNNMEARAECLAKIGELKLLSLAENPPSFTNDVLGCFAIDPAEPLNSDGSIVVGLTRAELKKAIPLPWTDSIFEAAGEECLRLAFRYEKGSEVRVDKCRDAIHFFTISRILFEEANLFNEAERVHRLILKAKDEVAEGHRTLQCFIVEAIRSYFEVGESKVQMAQKSTLVGSKTSFLKDAKKLYLKAFKMIESQTSIYGGNLISESERALYDEAFMNIERRLNS